MSSIEMGEHVGEEHYPDLRRHHVPGAETGRSTAAAADVAKRRRRPGRRAVHRGLHRARHAHAAAVADAAYLRTRGSRSATSRLCASTTSAPSSTGSPRFERRLRRVRRAAGRGDGPGVAAVPRRRRAGVRGRAGWASTRSWRPRRSKYWLFAKRLVTWISRTTSSRRSRPHRRCSPAGQGVDRSVPG